MALPRLKKGAKLPGGKKRAGRKATKVRSPRFVLFIGDEGAILIYIKDGGVQSRQFVPDAGEQNLKELKDNLDVDPKAPVLLVIDSMDQSFVQQTLPPVSALSVKKLIKRRLERDFGTHEIKGAIVLGREKTGRKDWNFLMVALEKSPQLTTWLDFVGDLPNRLQGIYLMSAEAENVVKELERTMGVSKEGSGAQWTFFVSHNKVGGFRQVIMKDGHIIFTRLAQPVGDSTPEVVAGSIEQEMLSTIEYMRRLSFDPVQGLDIYIVAASAIKSAIDRTKFEANAFRIMTPYEVAQQLSIEGATQPTDQFGDVVMAAAIGLSRKHTLTLFTPAAQQFETYHKLRLMQRGLAAAIGVAILGYGCSIAYDAYSIYSKNGELQEAKERQQKNLVQLQKEIKDANLDVEASNDIIDLYQELLKESLNPLPFIAALDKVALPPARIKNIDWSLDGFGGPAGAAPASAAASAAPPAASPPPGGTIAAGQPGTGIRTTVLMTLQYPASMQVDAMKAASKKLLDDAKAALPGFDVSYTKLPTGFSESEKLDLTLGSDAPGTVQNNQPVDLQMTIKGDLSTLPQEHP